MIGIIVQTTYRGLVFGHFRGTISVYHQISVNMQGADKGSKDTALQWESILPISPYGEWMFHSTPFNSAAYGTRSVYAITHTGGSTYAGQSRENNRLQRPALYIFGSYGKYRSST